MYSDWSAAADAMIAKLMENLPATATWQDRQAVLRKSAYDFHGDTSWGRKVWSKRCTAYLAIHGKPPRRKPQEAAEPLFPADIIFPFRGK